MNANYEKYKAIGKEAENIFVFLINSLKNEGWKVIPFGIENHIESLKENLKDNYNNEAENIRHMPDFVVLNTKTHEVMLIEVKRKSFVDKRKLSQLIFGFKKDEIERYKKYWNNAKLFIIHQQEPYFYIVNLNDIDTTKHKLKGNFYTGLLNLQNNKRPMNHWNFKEICLSIKDVFPNIPDETLSEAISMIRTYKREEKTTEDTKLENEFLDEQKQESYGYTKEELILLGFNEILAEYYADFK